MDKTENKNSLFLNQYSKIDKHKDRTGHIIIDDYVLLSESNRVFLAEDCFTCHQWLVHTNRHNFES